MPTTTTKKKEKRWVWIITRGWGAGGDSEIVYVCDSEKKSDAYLAKHPNWELLVDECELH